MNGLITVRTSSSRLTEKCLLPFGRDLNVIQHIIRRCHFYNIKPILCTSTHSSDDILLKIAKNEGVKAFRGSLINKLQRWVDCCNEYNLDSFHSIDADDPFFDGKLIKKSMDLLERGYDVVCPTKASSNGAASVGYSLKTKIIEKATSLTSHNSDTEMIWYYLDKVPGIKKINLTEKDEDKSKVRLTLDYEEDYWLLESVRRILGNNCTRKEVDNLFKNNPDLYKINWFRNQEWKKNQESKEV